LRRSHVPTSLTSIARADGGANSGHDEAVAPFGSRLLGPRHQDPRALRQRIQVLATMGIVGANLVGVAVVTALAGWVLPRPEPVRRSMFVANAVAIPLYVAVAVGVGVVWGTRVALSRFAWALDGTSPGPGQQRTALRTPLTLAAMQLLLWALAVVVFTGLALTVQPGLALNGALTVAFGGVVTCTSTYLLAEFAFRPLSARTLAAETPPDLLVPGVEARWLLVWSLGSGLPVAGLMTVAAFSLARHDVSASQLAVTILALGTTTLVVGLLLAWLAVRATVDPIRALRASVVEVEHGDLDTEVVVYDGSEVGLLQAAFNRMVAGLRERERIRDLFGRHVGEDVAREALAREVELGGEVLDVAVLFVDIVGSTALAANRPATEVVGLLNRFFAVVVTAVTECGGSINKFEGDGALALFGAPVPIDGHAGAALRAARLIDQRLRETLPDLVAGIGVSAGAAVAGNVGQEQRFEYTVIGDPVNEAARLCDLAKDTARRVVASRAAVEMADPGERRRWTTGDDVVLRGRARPTTLAVPR
jgi:adenylate cyclase